jgi:hypothetical protein
MMHEANSQEKSMRFAAVLSVIALVLAPGAATAQDDRGPTSPPYYINKDARFAILFPATPTISDVTYTTAAGARVAAKLYSTTQGNGQYNVTVVSLPTGPAVDAATVQHAVDAILRKGMLVYQSQAEYEPGVGSRQMIISLPGGRQIQAAVYMWDRRLYIVEGTGMSGSPPLLRFAQSIVLFQANGEEVQGDGGGGPPGGGRGGGGGGRGGN